MKRIIALAMALAMLLGCGALAESTLNVTGSGTVYVAADRVSASPPSMERTWANCKITGTR